MRRLSNNTLNENSTEGTLCELIKTTKHERNCNHLFHNRLKYLKCLQTHGMCDVCYYLWKTKQPTVIYLFTSLILYSVQLQPTHFLCLVSFLLSPFFPPPHPFFYRLKNLDQFILISFPASPEIFSSLRLHPFPCLSPSTAISLVEGQWLEWGPWSRCSVTCNTGTQERQRRCSSSVHGWAECKGLHQESRECTNPSCSGKARK